VKKYNCLLKMEKLNKHIFCIYVDVLIKEVFNFNQQYLIYLRMQKKVLSWI
jgi:hypothetical protein